MDLFNFYLVECKDNVCMYITQKLFKVLMVLCCLLMLHWQIIFVRSFFPCFTTYPMQVMIYLCVFNIYIYISKYCVQI